MTPSGKTVRQEGHTPASPAEQLHERTYDQLRVEVYFSPAALGAASARDFAEALRQTLTSRDVTSVIFASANSQLPFLEALRARQDIEWGRVHVLHMDEYLGMPSDHPASFRRFLHDHLVRWVRPLGFHELCGDAADPVEEVDRYSALLENLDPSICVLGIGENGHLAFNDPPADFATGDLVHRVKLEEACRRQQWGEGHFPKLEDVPTEALSLTIPALLRPGHVLCVVPELRKARAVRAALQDPVSPDCPASILRTVSSAKLYLDTASASLL
jgi:glucosamine-6-phosphate deaminase